MKLCFNDRLTLIGGALLVTLAAAAHAVTPDQKIPASQVADQIYVNGRIYTGEENQAWADALAVRGDRLIAVGTKQQVIATADDTTRIMDLGGNMVMPGIHDMHAHLSQAGTKELFECGFPFTLSVAEIVAKVTECANEIPAGEWLRGGQWAMELLDGEIKPSRQLLDAAAPKHPVLLIDSTVHAVWVNSMAMKLLGITHETGDPEGGVIARDAMTGEPTGILYDNAAYAQMQKLPAYSTEQMQQALSWSVSQFNAVGVTSIHDAMVDGEALAGYQALDRDGKLNAHIATSLAWRMLWAGPQDELQAVIAARGKSASENVHVDFAKIMLDGIPPSQTAAVLEPYLPDGSHPEGHRGYLTQSPELLKQDLIALDRQGIAVKIHATGDRSARVALDAIEAARKANGPSGLWHEVSHAEMIHPQDLPRFAALNVVAEMCPILWYPGPLHTMMENALGKDRAERFWQSKTLIESGALVNYGSDWPSVVPSANPWPGIEAMVTRKDPYSDDPASLGAGEALDLKRVLQIFTLNGARSVYMDDVTGSLAPGKYADFIVIDQHLFDIAPESISDTRVLRTVFRGNTVYESR
jgi:predicted amidohydrolase YtcJ